MNWTAGIPLSEISYTYYVDRFNPLVYQDQTNVKTTFISTPSLLQTLQTNTYLPNNTLDIDANGVRGGLVLPVECITLVRDILRIWFVDGGR